MQRFQRTARAALIPVLILSLAAFAVAQEPHDYYQFRSNNLVPVPYGPVALPGATSGMWTNPAGVGADGSSGFLFTKPSSADGYSDYLSDDLAWGVNLDGLGFGVQYLNGNTEARRYTWSVGTEIEEGLYFGAAYHWTSDLNMQNSWDFGLLARPTRWLSIGATATEAIGGDYSVDPLGKKVDADPTYHAGLAVRPFGPMLTLTGDVTFSKVGIDGTSVDYMEDLDPTFTASIMPLDGITIRGGYAVDSETVFAGLSLSFGMSTFGSWSGFANDPAPGQPDDAGATWIRTSSQWQPSIFDMFDRKKVVKMSLSGRLVEEPQPFSFFRGQNPTMLEKIQQLDQIADDPSVTAVWLELNGLSAQLADLQELRGAIQRVQDSGKQVFVYATDLSFGQYYLASAADKIYMQPTGVIAIPGIGYESMHVKSFMEKFHLVPQVERIGKYKSAAELVIADSASAEAEEAMNAILDDWFDEWVNTVAEGRGAARGDVRSWVDEVIHNGTDAADLGMIDAALYDDEVKDEIKSELGDKAQFVSSGQYFGIEHADPVWDDMTSPKIAVIFAEGMIVTGKSGRMGWNSSPYIGSETLASLIRQARNDRRVKAIVMRVDSPGGSGLASDIIAREVQLTTNPEDEDADSKPFIVSMSGVAGSGGYYIACFADDIVAPTTSITGSIGVLAMNLDYHPLMDTLGVHFDPNYRGENAGMFNGREWNEEQRGIIYDEISSHYQVFIGHVAEGRGMTKDAVDAVGQGRVWSGQDAVAKNLVDENGGLYEAIQMAKLNIGMDTDEKVDLKLYYPGSSWNVGSDFNALVFNQMPDPVRDLLVREEMMRVLDEESMNMLTPVNADDLYLD